MKPIFVKEWHGVSIASISSENNRNKLPDKHFYYNFYEEICRRYKSWEDLDPSWVEHKINTARFIETRLPGGGKILSIGCGLGIVEKYLIDSGVKNFNVQEVSDMPLQWLRPFLDEKAVYIGVFPECMLLSGKYRFIILSTVDYCFNQYDLIELLKSIRGKLDATGRCLVITSTYQDETAGVFSSESFRCMKFFFKGFLSFFGLYDRGYFMGWGRTKVEYRDAMSSAGFSFLEDGFISDALVPKSYWIEGARETID